MMAFQKGGLSLKYVQVSNEIPNEVTKLRKKRDDGISKDHLTADMMPQLENLRAGIIIYPGFDQEEGCRTLEHLADMMPQLENLGAGIIIYPGFD
ncbi:hypothetical protein Patl1_14119 [Pistacia atlantica]|uniref:Uncharacterized protein n=1 Tax=Pistacia atlantica TaxID=434234 RepID=A0ACC1ATV2_9ROSI|nr:hypothetical protein Patl1_14119 [Pistacia atlantica]